MLLNKQPLVSIVIPCYNHANFVQDCIQSVIDQTYHNIELIIIDDGSKDESVEKIRQLVSQCQERFVRFEFRHRPNKGLCGTLNEALEWCKGEYYSVIASDDMIYRDKTQIQVDYLEKNNECVAVFGGYDLIDNDNHIIEKRQNSFKKYQFERIFLHEHDLPAPTQIIRMNILRELGGYRSDIIIEDWYMWLKLAKFGELHYLNHTFSRYRSHPDNISKKIEIMNKGRFQVINEYKDNPLYNNAKRQITWISLNESRRSESKKYIMNFIFFIVLNPVFFMNKFKNRYLK